MTWHDETEMHQVNIEDIGHQDNINETCATDDRTTMDEDQGESDAAR